MKKSPDLLLIESAFQEIKSNPKGNKRQDIETIKRVLSRRYDIKVEINIVENTGMNFFGMSIYPESDIIDKMVDSIIEGTNRVEVLDEIWAKNKNWVIDIDSILLYDVSLNANPSEITAVLLHEIGHTVHSNAIPSRVGKVLKYTRMNMSIGVKKILKWTKARRILGLAFIEASSNTNFHSSGVSTEIAADRLAIKEGYSQDLSAFINKLISKKGNSLVDRSEKELENEIETVVQWAVTNISQLEFRKNVLNRNIKAQMLATRSPFIRDYLMRVRNLFFGDESDRFQSMVVEQNVMREYRKYDVVTEAFKDWFGKNGKIQKITANDIDMILIEANRIENENDRIYVLDLVYSKLDIIELSLDLLQNKETASRVQVSKDTLLRQKEELANVRRQVMSIKVRAKDFNVLVNYPVGYEG